MDEDDIEAIREQKRQEIEERMSQDQASSRDAAADDQQKQKQAVLRRILTEDARRRFNTVRMTHPERVEQIESQLLALVQQGRLPDDAEIDDEQAQELLRKISENESQEFNIKRR